MGPVAFLVVAPRCQPLGSSVSAFHSFSSPPLVKESLAGTEPIRKDQLQVSHGRVRRSVHAMLAREETLTSAAKDDIERVSYDGRVWWRSVFAVRGRAVPFQQILSCAAFGVASCLISALRKHPLILPNLAHTLCCAPLGFLLVFRLNQCTILDANLVLHIRRAKLLYRMLPRAPILT